MEVINEEVKQEKAWNFEFQTHFEKCKFLHELTYGYQDKYIDTMKEGYISPIKSTGNVIPISVTQLIEPKGELQPYQNQFTHKFVLNYKPYLQLDNDKKYGISNIRVKANKEDVQFELHLGGQRLEKIGWHPHFQDNDGFYSFEITKNNIIPIYDVFIHEVYIGINYIEPVEISYTLDYIEIEPFPQNDFIDCMYRSNQFTGFEIAKGGVENKFNMYFNHPMEALDIITTKKLNKIRFGINSEMNNSFDISLTKEKDDYFVYQIKFNPTINFSRIDHPTLQVLCDEDTEICTFGKYLGIMSMQNGMYGGRFTK